MLKIDSILNEYLKKGIIRPSKSPICFAAFLFNKKSDNKRLVIDYVKLNKNSLPDHFPLPSCDLIIDKLQDKIIFSKVDLSDECFHVVLDQETVF